MDRQHGDGTGPVSLTKGARSRAWNRAARLLRAAHREEFQALYEQELVTALEEEARMQAGTAPPPAVQLRPAPRPDDQLPVDRAAQLATLRRMRCRNCGKDGTHRAEACFDPVAGRRFTRHHFELQPLPGATA